VRQRAAADVDLMNNRSRAIVGRARQALAWTWGDGPSELGGWLLARYMALA
jgi:hypothetical protein